MPSHPSNPSKNKHLKAPRARFHDYCAPGYYFITISTHKNTLPLSHIPFPPDGLPEQGQFITPDLTPLGEAVRQELLNLSSREPRLWVVRYVIMPDHIHFVLHVKERLEKPIGKYIAPFVVACSRAYTNLVSLPAFTSLFQPFDDSIIFDRVQLDRAIKYIIDNPRRYLIRRRYPDLFKRHLNLIIGDHAYAAFGNMFLIKRYNLLPIRIHRRWSQEEFREYIESCRQEITKGAIPISPAIHPVEKQIIEAAIEDGSPVIILRDLSFNERYKPSGKHFELCSEGRLLYLCPWPENLSRRSTAGYDIFHRMNDFASALASLPSTTRLSIHLPNES